MTNFSCSISERPADQGYVVRRFEFPGGLLPPRRAVEEIDREIPGLDGPISYLLGQFIARLQVEIESGHEQWAVRYVKPVLESRDNGFALIAVEVTLMLRRPSGSRVINVAVIRSAAAWMGLRLDPSELIRLTEPRRQH